MPNDFTDAVHADIKAVETWAVAELSAFENDLEQAWANLKPAIIALGRTALGQVAAAAESVVIGKATVSDALASVEVQLVADGVQAAVATRAALAGALATNVAQLAAAAPSTPSTPAAQ